MLRLAHCLGLSLGAALCYVLGDSPGTVIVASLVTRAGPGAGHICWELGQVRRPTYHLGSADQAHCLAQHLGACLAPVLFTIFGSFAAGNEGGNQCE